MVHPAGFPTQPLAWSRDRDDQSEAAHRVKRLEAEKSIIRLDLVNMVIRIRQIVNTINLLRE